MKLELSVVISQIITFLIMLWVLKLFAWKPFLKLLDERKRKIEEGFSAIEKEKLELKKLADAYQERLDQIDEEGRKRLQEAIYQSEKAAKEISQQAQYDAKAMLEKARKQIAQEAAAARLELKETLVNLIVTATEKMVGEKLEEGADRKKIAEFLTQMELK